MSSNFVDAELFGGNLSNADCRKATFVDANLTQSTLSGADLTDVAWDDFPPLPPLPAARPQLGLVGITGAVLANTAATLCGIESGDKDMMKEAEEQEAAQKAGSKDDGNPIIAAWSGEKALGDFAIMVIDNDFSNSSTQDDAVDAVIACLAANRAAIEWRHVKKEVQDALRCGIKPALKKARRCGGEQATALLLDTRNLVAQYGHVRAAHEGHLRAELRTLLKICAVMTATVDRINEVGQPSGLAECLIRAADLWFEQSRDEASHSASAANRYRSLLSVKANFVSDYRFSLLTQLPTILMQSAGQMAADLSELEFLKSKIALLSDTETGDGWDDSIQVWSALRDLSYKFEGQRAQTILRLIFADKPLTAALGMGYQLRDVDTKGNLPGSVIRLFKQGTGNSMKRDQYTYVQAIEAEIASIEEVKQRQSSFRTLISTSIGAAMTGASIHLWGQVLGSEEGEQQFLVNLLAPGAGRDSSMSD